MKIHPLSVSYAMLLSSVSVLVVGTISMLRALLSPSSTDYDIFGGITGDKG